MRLGIFAKTYCHPTLGGVLDAICEHGIRDVHFNLASAGVESLPVDPSPELCRTIRAAFASRGLTMCSISGTFNAIHPDIGQRAEYTRRACRLIERCPELGTSIVSLCTGTRCPDDMWTAHPDNGQSAAWDDLRRTLEALVDAANRAGVALGVEPEHANVIDSAEKARRLLDDFGSPHNLKIVIDAANLLKAETLGQSHAVLDIALDLLGPDLVIAHAKDMPRTPGGSRAAGSGLVPWKYYLASLHRSGFTGPLVLHGLEERDVSESVRFLAALGCRSAQAASTSSGEGAPT